MDRWLGLDLGRRFWGLALGNPMSGTVQTLGVLESSDRERCLREIRRFLRDYDVRCIVVGLPLRNGGWTKTTETIYAQAKWLQRRLPRMTWMFVDETGSTMAGRKVLPGVRSDDVAAAVILQRGWHEPSFRLDGKAIRAKRRRYLTRSEAKK